MGVNFPFILHKKPTFFYFTYSILQNTHINLSILHVCSIKYSFFYKFLLFSPPLSPLSHRPNNTNNHSTPSLHHHPPNQHHQGKSTHSIRETNTLKLTQFETQSIDAIDALVSSLAQSKTGTIDFITSFGLITPIDTP